MTPLDRVCDVLDQHSIGYALIGAAALAVYGVARSTFDIDLLATDRGVLDAALWTAFGDQAEIRRGDADDPLAGVVRITSGDDRPIDIVVGKLAWQTRAVDRARPFGDRAPVVEACDLVLLKLYAGGDQDLWDVRELLKQSDRSLHSAVTAALDGLPADLHARWESL
jgi:hypothetical protein